MFRLDLTPEQSIALVGELEGLIAANINHLSIAAPIAAGMESGAVYLAQEYAVGDSLDVVLRERGPMSIGDAEPLVDSLAGALAHAASRGVQHGSLHPRDIILAPDTARITGLGIAAALRKISAKLPTRPQYAPSDGPSDAFALGAIVFEMVTGKRVTLDGGREFMAEHRDDLHGALGAALSAVGAAPAFAPDKPIASAGKPNAPIAPAAPAFALEEPIASAGKSDFDLRIDQRFELMAETPDDLLDTFIEPAPPTFPAAWSAQPPRALHPADAHVPARARRWPIVAVFLGFAIVAALSVGFFLQSPTPVAPLEPAAVVDETTVDLPASAPTPAPAPVPQASPTLPAPTPSRPASGAVVGSQTPARGSLLIRSSPADADVVVNGTARGKTPLTVRDLELGSYTIRVARDGYANEERTLQLTARRPTASTTFDLRETPASATRGTAGASASARGATADKTAGMPGSINVQSRPAGARVFVNDRLMGSTPLAIPGLPAGPATVRIELDGYRTWTTMIQVGAGERSRVAASLERK
ncbi:MAG: PEGA domain-containing protein [Acidobacteria bacterium]|nr:PEGA domain-containing protein [Acidobacteriota bacterium]